MWRSLSACGLFIGAATCGASRALATRAKRRPHVWVANLNEKGGEAVGRSGVTAAPAEGISWCPADAPQAVSGLS